MQLNNHTKSKKRKKFTLKQFNDVMFRYGFMLYGALLIVVGEPLLAIVAILVSIWHILLRIQEDEG